MKTLFLNHKNQASFISFLVFLPLAFLLFNSANFFKIEFKSVESFSLSMKQFVAKPIKQKIKEPINESIKEPPISEKLVQKIEKKPIKTATKQTKIKENSAQNLVQNKQIPTQNLNEVSKTQEQTSPKIDTELLTQGKDEHPLLKKIQQAIQEAQIYPRQAQKMRMKGVAKVEFLWKKDKILAEVKIIQSSGHALLDKSALESIKRASVNFPYYKNDLRIILPIVYDLKS